MKRALYFIIAVMMINLPAASLPKRVTVERQSYEVRR
jgi:hypothetical protein